MVTYSTNQFQKGRGLRKKGYIDEKQGIYPKSKRGVPFGHTNIEYLVNIYYNYNDSKQYFWRYLLAGFTTRQLVVHSYIANWH